MAWIGNEWLNLQRHVQLLVTSATKLTIRSAARRQSKVPTRPGPVTSIGDHDLLQLIRLVLRASPFAGEATARFAPGSAASTASR